MIGGGSIAPKVPGGKTERVDSHNDMVAQVKALFGHPDKDE